MTDQEFMYLWRSFLLLIKEKVNVSGLGMWFGNSVPVSIVQGTMFLIVEDDLRSFVIKQRYLPEIEAFFTEMTGEQVTLCVLKESESQGLPFYVQNEPELRARAKIVIDEVLADPINPAAAVTPPFSTVPKEKDLFSPSFPNSIAQKDPIPKQPEIDPADPVANGNFVIDDITSTNPGANAFDSSGVLFDFNHFIVGSSNKFAHAACWAVAQEPARQYNPLFIHGHSGLGKTHLMKAIINHLRLTRPELKIRYVKGDEFTNQMIESISFGRNEQFRNSYRKVDVLFIDDIQFIAGKESTQEEFFHTFNALYEDEKQIILTSDRPPRDIPHLEDRLRTRFESGLIADIQPPDLELRIAILKNKSQLMGYEMPPEVLTFIAENLVSNVRQLEGAVKKIAAQCKLMGKGVTIDLAFQCISDMIVGSEPVAMTADKIIGKVAQKYEVSIEDLKGSKRTKNIAHARHIAVYLLRELTDMSLPQLGKYFGRDHTTILNSHKTVVEEIKKDPLLDLEIKELLKDCKGK